MKTVHLFSSLTMLCTAAALVGCASTERQAAAPSFDGQHRHPDAVASAAGVSQPVPLSEPSLRKSDLKAAGANPVNDWQHFQATTVGKEINRAQDEDEDGPINMSESLRQPAKRPSRLQFLGEADLDPAWDARMFRDTRAYQQQGWRLLSIHF